jgi:hypothetical protein
MEWDPGPSESFAKRSRSEAFRSEIREAWGAISLTIRSVGGTLLTIQARVLNIQPVCAKSLVVALRYLIVARPDADEAVAGLDGVPWRLLPAARMSRFMIAKNDTQPCTLGPEVHGCVSLSAILKGVRTIPAHSHQPTPAMNQRLGPPPNAT